MLRLLYLFTYQNFSSEKILKVLIIYNNIDGEDWTFEIIALNFEEFRNGWEILVISVIV